MNNIKKKVVVIVLSCIFLTVLATIPGIAFPGSNSSQLTSMSNMPWPEPYVPGQLLVGMASPVYPIDANIFPSIEIESIRDLTDVTGYTNSNGNPNWIYPGRQIILIELASEEEADMRAAIEALEAYEDVAYAEPNPIGRACAASSTTNTTLWNMEKIQADLAWQITTGSSDIMVGVMDSGADYTHPALDGNIDDTLGINFLYFNPYWWYETPAPDDDFGHGVHSAGIIGAIGGNDEGVIGVSQSVTIVPLKIWDSVGQGSVAEFIAAMVYADYLGIPVISLSGGWKGIGEFKAMRDAVGAYRGLLIAAAGNEANDNDDPATAYYPGAYQRYNIVSVAATDQNDGLYEFSGYGATSVNLAAPGDGILSSVNYWCWDIEDGWYTEPGYEAFSGTSAAVAHVTGAAVLLKTVAPDLSAAALKAALLYSVDQIPALNGLVQTGGRLNAYTALTNLTTSTLYSLHFWGDDYWIDAYEGMDFPVYLEAYVEDEFGAQVTAPGLVSIIYTAESGASNTTGIFTKEDLEISPGEMTFVTATALLSNGVILEEATVVVAPYISAR